LLHVVDTKPTQLPRQAQHLLHICNAHAPLMEQELLRAVDTKPMHLPRKTHMQAANEAIPKHLHKLSTAPKHQIQQP